MVSHLLNFLFMPILDKTYVISFQEISHKNKLFSIPFRYSYDVRLLHIKYSPVTYNM